jgi:CelD/BcsL family acetyltransferase involved in cellulose biosynthesis
MADAEFLVEWRLLHDSCPWSTIFQEALFARVWYGTYNQQYTPIIVTGRVAGKLCGLLLLALSWDGTTLCNVGAHHAEYPTWIDTEAQFLEAALDALAAKYSGHKLQFVFLPPGTRFQVTARWRGRCFLRPIPQPLMDTRPADAVRESLRKKSNKSKLSRLNRLGKLTVDRVVGAEEFASLLEETIPLCDFRQGALYNSFPFDSDSLKKPYYLALMRETDYLHVTAMRLDGRLIAIHIGMRNKDNVLVGILAHSPFFSEYSVGKLLLLKQGLLLEQEGIAALDLTPGGDYKNRFASRFEKAYTLTVFFDAWAARKYRLWRHLVEWAKQRRFIQQHREQFTAAVSLMRKGGLRAVRGRLWALLTRLFCEEQFRVYMARLPCAPRLLPSGLPLHIDSLEDLLRYRPAAPGAPSRQQFLRSTLTYLERGGHAYTRTGGGVLEYCAWLGRQLQENGVPLTDKALEMWAEEDHLPTNNPALRKASIHARLQDATQSGADAVFIHARATDKAAMRDIEDVGFAYCGKLILQHRWGRTKRHWFPEPPNPLLEASRK